MNLFICKCSDNEIHDDSHLALPIHRDYQEKKLAYRQPEVFVVLCVNLRSEMSIGRLREFHLLIQKVQHATALVFKQV